MSVARFRNHKPRHFSRPSLWAVAIVGILVVAGLLSGTVVVHRVARPGALSVLDSTGQASTSVCNPTALFHREWTTQSGINTAESAANALSSPGFQSLLRDLGVSRTTAYSSTYFLWQFGSNCTPRLQSINAVFFSRASNLTIQVTVSESPSDFAISNVTIEPGMPGNTVSSSSNPYWTGYYVITSSGPNAAWNVPTEHSYAGCSACDTDFWVGQTRVWGGDTGIAQTGTEELLYLVPGYGWLWEYYGWYEYYTNSGSTETNCLGIHAGDEVDAGTWYTNGQYYTGITNYRSGQSCTTNRWMSMGSPLYAWWIDEQQINPNGGNFGTPWFSTVTLQYVEYGAWTDLLQGTTLSDLTQDEYTGLGPMTYDNSSCAWGFSCFSVYFTG